MAVECAANVITPYIALGVSFLTGAFTLAGVALANKSSQKQSLLRLNSEYDREKREVLRNRLEEIYTLVDKWAGTVVMHHLRLRRVMEGNLTYNQALDLGQETKINFDPSRLFTLVELYFPDCHEIMKNIKKYRDEATVVQHNYKEYYRESGSVSASHADQITDVLEKFNSEIRAYKKSLTIYAQKV